MGRSQATAGSALDGPFNTASASVAVLVFHESIKARNNRQCAATADFEPRIKPTVANRTTSYSSGGKAFVFRKRFNRIDQVIVGHDYGIGTLIPKRQGIFVAFPEMLAGTNLAP